MKLKSWATASITAGFIFSLFASCSDGGGSSSKPAPQPKSVIVDATQLKPVNESDVYSEDALKNQLSFSVMYSDGTIKSAEEFEEAGMALDIKLQVPEANLKEVEEEVSPLAEDSGEPQQPGSESEGTQESPETPESTVARYTYAVSDIDALENHRESVLVSVNASYSKKSDEENTDAVQAEPVSLSCEGFTLVIVQKANKVNVTIAQDDDAPELNYWKGDELDFSGITVEAVYGEGNTATSDIVDNAKVKWQFDIEGEKDELSTSASGKYEVTPYYAGLDATDENGDAVKIDFAVYEVIDEIAKSDGTDYAADENPTEDFGAKVKVMCGTEDVTSLFDITMKCTKAGGEEADLTADVLKVAGTYSYKVTVSAKEGFSIADKVIEGAFKVANAPKLISLVKGDLDSIEIADLIKASLEDSYSVSSSAGKNIKIKVAYFDETEKEISLGSEGVELSDVTGGENEITVSYKDPLFGDSAKKLTAADKINFSLYTIEEPESPLEEALVYSAVSDITNGWSVKLGNTTIADAVKVVRADGSIVDAEEIPQEDSGKTYYINASVQEKNLSVTAASLPVTCNGYEFSFIQNDSGNWSLGVTGYGKLTWKNEGYRIEKFTDIEFEKPESLYYVDYSGSNSYTFEKVENSAAVENGFKMDIVCDSAVWLGASDVTFTFRVKTTKESSAGKKDFYNITVKADSSKLNEEGIKVKSVTVTPTIPAPRIVVKDTTEITIGEGSTDAISREVTLKDFDLAGAETSKVKARFAEGSSVGTLSIENEADKWVLKVTPYENAAGSGIIEIYYDDESAGIESVQIPVKVAELEKVKLELVTGNDLRIIGNNGFVIQYKDIPDFGNTNASNLVTKYKKSSKDEWIKVTQTPAEFLNWKIYNPGSLSAENLDANLGNAATIRIEITIGEKLYWQEVMLNNSGVLSYNPGEPSFYLPSKSSTLTVENTTCEFKFYPIDIDDFDISNLTVSSDASSSALTVTKAATAESDGSYKITVEAANITENAAEKLTLSYGNISAVYDVNLVKEFNEVNVEVTSADTRIIENSGYVVTFNNISGFNASEFILKQYYKATETDAWTEIKSTPNEYVDWKVYNPNEAGTIGSLESAIIRLELINGATKYIVQTELIKK
ncbi:MAG: hypothetical protein PUI24_06985 [Spirochaetales bacterium]|nr:hypothetical protein [Spirochaetales bacterium]